MPAKRARSKPVTDLPASKVEIPDADALSRVREVGDGDAQPKFTKNMKALDAAMDEEDPQAEDVEPMTSEEQTSKKSRTSENKSNAAKTPSKKRTAPNQEREQKLMHEADTNTSSSKRRKKTSKQETSEDEAAEDGEDVSLTHSQDEPPVTSNGDYIADETNEQALAVLPKIPSLAADYKNPNDRLKQHQRFYFENVRLSDLTFRVTATDDKKRYFPHVDYAGIRDVGIWTPFMVVDNSMMYPFGNYELDHPGKDFTQGLLEKCKSSIQITSKAWRVEMENVYGQDVDVMKFVQWFNKFERWLARNIYNSPQLGSTTRAHVGAAFRAHVQEEVERRLDQLQQLAIRGIITPEEKAELDDPDKIAAKFTEEDEFEFFMKKFWWRKIRNREKKASSQGGEGSNGTPAAAQKFTYQRNKVDASQSIQYPHTEQFYIGHKVFSQRKPDAIKKMAKAGLLHTWHPEMVRMINANYVYNHVPLYNCCNMDKEVPPGPHLKLERGDVCAFELTLSGYGYASVNKCAGSTAAPRQILRYDSRPELVAGGFAPVVPPSKNLTFDGCMQYKTMDALTYEEEQEYAQALDNACAKRAASASSPSVTAEDELD